MLTYNDALEKAALIAESEDYHHDGEIWIVTQIAKKIRALKRPEPDTSHSGVFGEKQWKLVPPTQEMIDAWRLDQAQLRSLETSYKAMIDAAPPAPDPRDDLIKELMGALQLVDDDVRHHLRSDKIYHSLLRAHAVEAVRSALEKAKGVVDG